MPVVAVVAGIASAVGGVTALAAAGGIAAGFTMATVSAGLAIAGGVATALGAATGNKKLMKIGMVAGLGGAALGGLSAMTGAPAVGSSVGVSSLAESSGAGSGLGLVAKTSGEGLTGAGMMSLGGQTTASVGGELGAGLASVQTGVQPWQAGLSASASAPVVAQAAPSVPSPAASIAPDALSANTALRAEMTAPTMPTSKSMFSTATDALGDFGRTLGKNPELTKVGLGMLSSVGEAKSAKAAREETIRHLERERDRLNNSILKQRQAF